MRINTEIIRKLNPCESRFDNYLKHYAKFDGTLEDFIVLENISYSDKVWVVTRLFTKEQNVKWSLACASKVLSIFEEKYPEDKRPRLALEANEAWLNNPTEENRKTASAYYAAYPAAYYAASAAARAAYYAAYYAAYAAANAAYAAYYAADAAANAASAASAARAAYDADPRNLEEEVNLLLMLICLE